MKKLKQRNIVTRSWGSFRRRSRLVQVLLVVLLVGGIAQLVFDGWVHGAYQDALTRSDNDRLVMMMTNAIHDVTKPTVINPATKKVYLPDANIVLPPYPANVEEVRYEYSGAKGAQSMQVTTNDAIQSGNAKVIGTQPSANPGVIFSQVPNAQACASGVLVTFGSPTGQRDDSTIVYSKLLKDGREMDIYKQNSCHGYDFRPLTAYLKSAESY